MTCLHSMRPAAYAAYLEAAITAYAEDKTASATWPRAPSMDLSQKVFQDLLPQGLATPENHLFEILVHEGGPTVGYLWFAVLEQHGARSAFIYDVKIEEQHRRQGHAERAFLALEPYVAALGLADIGLHVFGHNAAAQALYRKLGYAVTDINMNKRITVFPNTASGPAVAVRAEV